MLGAVAFALLSAAAVAGPVRADDLDDLAEPDEKKPEAQPEAKPDATNEKADASEAAPPEVSADTAAAFGADAQGLDPEVVAKARGHFEQGVEFYSEGDYRAAMIELQRAYELHRTYKLLYNLGQVAYELRDYAGAERYFRDYLAKGGTELSPERRREIKSELARLRSRVATLRVSANQPDATFRVDDHAIVQPQGPVRVSAGRLTIRAEKSGFTPVERSIDVTGGEELNVQLAFGPSLTAAGSSEATQSSSKWPWVTGVMSGVFLVAAGGVGFAAYQDVAARDEALRKYTTRAELDGLGSQAHTKALVADALLGAALVSAAATVVLVLSGSGKPDTMATDAPPHARLPSALISF
jgi:tetratricopeptide (TPR) repeat protein